MSRTIRLPWPDAKLSPNARVHWAQQAKSKKHAREQAYYFALEAGCVGSSADSVHVSLTFCPPDKRRRDLDNALAASKASLDGIADALGVDDSRWRLSIQFGPVVKGGEVVVEVLK